MDEIKVYTEDEVLDLTLGEKGTPERDSFEASVEDYLIGRAIRKAREAQNLTQEELGERIGVKRARICSIEKGTNLRISTIRRIFSALGLNANLDIADMDSIPLC